MTTKAIQYSRFKRKPSSQISNNHRSRQSSTHQSLLSGNKKTKSKTKPTTTDAKMEKIRKPPIDKTHIDLKFTINKLKTVRYPGHPLPVVAESEFASLGSVAPKVRFPEGPFGDHYGCYSPQHNYPVFQCHKILCAKDANFPATVVSKPRQEDFYIVDYLQKLLSPLFPLVMPGVRDLLSYGETGFHALASAVVKERYPREAMVSAVRILGEGQLSLTKFLLVTDAAVDLKNSKLLLQHILERADFATDLYIFNRLSMDTLDYVGPEVNKGSKGILLGVGEKCRNLPGNFTGELPGFCKKAEAFCPGCLVVEGEMFERDKNLAERISGHSAFKDFPLIVLVDDIKKTLHSTAAFLWTAFTRMEPAGDFPNEKMIAPMAPVLNRKKYLGVSDCLATRAAQGVS